MVSVGSAAVEISPPIGSSVSGQFYDRTARFIHDPLFARAFVIDDGTTQAALVACDLVAVGRETVVEARRLASAWSGIPAENILITASHTHAGPRTKDGFPVPADKRYVSTLPAKFAEAVSLAAVRRQSATIGAGSGWEESASHNRRFLRKDGTAQMHPPKGDPSFIGPEGPDDPEVGVVFARGTDRQLIGTIVNYSSHPIVVGHENAISADYPGYLVKAVQAVKGREGEVLFVNGACGNLCPFDVYDLKHREYGYAWAERVGNVLAAEAIRVIEKTDAIPDVKVRVASREIDLEIRPISEGQIEAARSLLAQAEPRWRPGMAREEFEDYRERIYAQELLHVAEERRQSPTIAAEVQVIAIGDAAFVSIPGEYFVEFGLEIKRRSPFLFTYIAELANGAVGYIPTRRAFEGGGYETRLARSSKLIPAAGEQLAEVALGLLNQVHPEA